MPSAAGATPTTVASYAAYKPSGPLYNLHHWYAVQDHLKTVTDAESNATTYTTGDRDLMTQQVSPVSGTTTYGYNEHGQLTTETDARPVTVTRTVDALDRVTLVDYTDNTLDTSFVYDGPAGVPTAFWKGRTRERGGTLPETPIRVHRTLIRTAMCEAILSLAKIRWAGSESTTTATASRRLIHSFPATA